MPADPTCSARPVDQCTREPPEPCVHSHACHRTQTVNKPRSMPTSREAVISDMFAVMWSILLKVASNHVKMVRRFQSSHSMIFRGFAVFHTSTHRFGSC